MVATVLASLLHSNLPVWAARFYFWVRGRIPQTFHLGGLQSAISGNEVGSGSWQMWAYSKSSRARHGTMITNISCSIRAMAMLSEIGKLLVISGHSQITLKTHWLHFQKKCDGGGAFILALLEFSAAFELNEYGMDSTVLCWFTTFSGVSTSGWWWGGKEILFSILLCAVL